MNIESLNKPKQQNNSENIAGNINAVNSFSFELELPDSSFAELLQSEDKSEEEKNAANQIDLALNKKNKLVRSLQNLANKDRIPFKLKDIQDIKLLIYSHDMLRHKDKFKIDINSLNDNDINFLKDFMNNPNITISSFNPQNLQLTLSSVEQSGQISYKSFNISKGLADLIEYAYTSQKPVRLDFEGNSSVILRVDSEGKLTAEFISSNKAMETILKNSIPNLRNKLDSEGIPYKEIVYKERNRKQNKEEQERK